MAKVGWILASLAVAVSVVYVGCGSTARLSTPEEMKAAVSNGMTKKQVIAAIGEPDVVTYMPEREMLRWEFDDQRMYGVVLIDGVVQGHGVTDVGALLRSGTAGQSR